MSELPQKPVKPMGFNPQNQSGASGGSWLGGCALGCGITLFLLAIIVAVGIYLLYTRGHRLAADIAKTAINRTIDEIDALPADEKRTIKEQIERVVVAYKNGDITAEELGAAFEDISKSPVIGAVILLAIKSQYLDASGLSAGEKQEAEKIVQRTWLGIIEEKIKQEDLDKAFEMIADRKDDSENEWTMRDKVSDDELRGFFAELKQLADQAGIPDEFHDISIGDEIRKIIDKLLDEAGDPAGGDGT